MRRILATISTPSSRRVVKMLHQNPNITARLILRRASRISLFPLMRKTLGCAALLLAVTMAVSAEIFDIEVGKFSAQAKGGTLPEEWQPLTFEGIDSRTQYELVKDDGVVVVKALARASGSGLIRHIRIEPREYPVIRWRWKVANILEKGDLTRKEGDDEPARLLIFFEYDPARAGLVDKAKYELARLLYGAYPPRSGISYIWDSKAPAGTVVPNINVKEVKMFVVESGAEKLNTWVEEQRNLYFDYKTAFGEEPPPIASIALMTDTDVTGETATAYYGDIVLMKKTR